jgi:hypothetical protein
MNSNETPATVGVTFSSLQRLAKDVGQPEFGLGTCVFAGCEVKFDDPLKKNCSSERYVVSALVLFIDQNCKRALTLQWKSGPRRGAYKEICIWVEYYSILYI